VFDWVTETESYWLGHVHLRSAFYAAAFCAK